ncbi:MAG: lysylphosphatidylglycerol synthase transmembrane domain-containing protein, partial [Polyangiales bacterium]
MVLAVLVLAGLSIYADVQALTRSLGQIHPVAVFWALLLATCNYVLRYGRWHLYLQLLQVQVPHRTNALIFTAGFVMSITPGKLGEVFKALLLREHAAVPVSRTAPLVLAERLTDLLALVLLLAWGCTVFPWGLSLAGAGAAMVGVALFACAYRPVGILLLRLVQHLPVLRRAGDNLHAAYEALHLCLRWRPLLLALVLSTAAWFCECLALWVLVEDLIPTHFSLAGAVFGYAAPTLAGALALMPGGLGVTEASMTLVLQRLSAGHLSPSAATVVTLLVRLVTLWWAVLLGGFA